MEHQRHEVVSRIVHLVAVVGCVVIAGSRSTSGQTDVRPDITGTWLLNRELSSPSGSPGSRGGGPGDEGQPPPRGGGMGGPGCPVPVEWAGAAALAVRAGVRCPTVRRWNGHAPRWKA